MDWIDLGVSCTHCGADIESRPLFTPDIVMGGCEPMEHRHIATGEPTCTVTITYQASPYTDWLLMEKYHKRSDALIEEDAECTEDVLVVSPDLPDYYIGKYQVTQALWCNVMGTRPSYFSGDNRPVERVSWHDAEARTNGTT